MDGFNDAMSQLNQFTSPLTDSLSPITNTFFNQLNNFGKLTSGLTDALLHLIPSLGQNLVNWLDPKMILLIGGGLIVGLMLFNSMKSSGTSFSIDELMALRHV